MIEVAMDLFTQNGIAGTATAEIAKALKLSHGTVFIHFPTRDDLVLAVIDEFGRKLSEELRSAIEGDLPLERVLKGHLQALAEFEDFYFRLITEMHSLPEKVQGTVFMLNAAISWKLYEAAKPLMKQGRVKKIDRPLFFNTWMSLVTYHVIYREQLSEKRPVLRAKQEELIRHFLNLVKPE